MRLCVSALIPLLLSVSAAVPGTAANDRTLCFYHTHTTKSECFTFKRDGVFDQAVLKQMNVFLADWRTHEPTKMDPALFDLLWEVYQDVGGTKPYNIVSSYRSPATNAMLRAKSSGVAENSQHMAGKAMDVFIPGVPLATLRAAAMRHQVGGVGYYPTSGSPFVHMDTGSVRAWPRMTRAQLKNIFPDGKTLHLPVDGSPLSDSGRQYAMAQWNKCHQVPCSGAPGPLAGGGDVQLASLDPTQTTVSTIAVSAPTPAIRPSTLSGSTLATALVQMPSRFAPIPAMKSPELTLATRNARPSTETALGAIGTIPQPVSLMSPSDDALLTAYAPEIVPDEGAQRALQILIERETTASLGLEGANEPADAVDTSGLRTASLDSSNSIAAPGLLDLTFSALSEANDGSGMADDLIAMSDGFSPSFRPNQYDFVATDLDHDSDDAMSLPIPMSSSHFAELYEPEGYLNRSAELGIYADRIGLESNLYAPPAYDHFSRDMQAILTN